MISVSYVYDTIQTLIRKDQKGNSFSISEFNRLAKAVNYELYNFFADKVGESSKYREAVKNFITLQEAISLTSGVGDIPTDYGRLLGQPYLVSGSDVIPVDEMEETEKAWRLRDTLTKPTASYPACIIGGVDGGGVSQITVYPNTISTVYIDYLSIPATPILDYYITSTGLYVYLDQGATGVSVPAGAVYSDGTPGPVSKDSQTIDFEWDEDQIPILIDMLLQKAGIVLDSQIPIEYGVAKQTKEEA